MTLPRSHANMQLSTINLRAIKQRATRLNAHCGASKCMFSVLSRSAWQIVNANYNESNNFYVFFCTFNAFENKRKPYVTRGAAKATVNGCATLTLYCCCVTSTRNATVKIDRSNRIGFGIFFMSQSCTNLPQSHLPCRSVCCSHLLHLWLLCPTLFAPAAP